MEKPLKDWTFEELTEYNMMRIHSRFLEEGSKGLKNGVWMAQQLTLNWKEEMDKENAKKTEKR